LVQAITVYHSCLYLKVALPAVVPGLGYRRLGTQQVEQEVIKLFPKAKVDRMDLDTTRKHAYEKNHYLVSWNNKNWIS
jgi:primosomal protein N' (replication factor Y)